MTSSAVPAVKLRVTITIDVDAEDYRDAAAHQARLEEHIAILRQHYPSAEITARDRRGPRPRTPSPHRRAIVTSGRLNAYE